MISLDKKIIIRVPATSTGLGTGVDSIGIAFGLYYTVIVEEEMQHWQVNHALGKDIPHNEDNLIVKTILQIDSSIKPHQLTVMSDVPIGKGLGASTTAVAAGIKIANALGDLNMSLDDQIKAGSKMEGHADGIASALLGDITVSYFDGDMATTVKAPTPEAINALIYINKQEPDLNHNVYKQNISSNQAIMASSATNVLVAALMSNEWTKATEMMEKETFYVDNINEKVPELSIIKKHAHELGIYGTYVSKTGQAIITFGTTSELNQLRDVLSTADINGNLRLIKIDHDGATVRGE